MRKIHRTSLTMPPQKPGDAQQGLASHRRVLYLRNSASPTCRSMTEPRTPKKGRGLSDIIEELNCSYGLHILDRNKPGNGESPSKTKSHGSLEHKVYVKLKKTFYDWANRDEFDLALDKFNAHAQQAFSRWQFKPKAETDTLPSRSPGMSVIYERQEIAQEDPSNEATAHRLLEALLRFLGDIPQVPPSREALPREILQGRDSSLIPAQFSRSTLAQSPSGQIDVSRSLWQRNTSNHGAEKGSDLSGRRNDKMDLSNSKTISSSSQNPFGLEVSLKRFGAANTSFDEESSKGLIPESLIYNARFPVDGRSVNLSPALPGDYRSYPNNNTFSMQPEIVKLHHDTGARSRKRPQEGPDEDGIARKVPHKGNAPSDTTHVTVNNFKPFEDELQQVAASFTKASTATTITSPNTSFGPSTTRTSFSSDYEPSSKKWPLKPTESFVSNVFSRTNIGENNKMDIDKGKTMATGKSGGLAPPQNERMHQQTDEAPSSLERSLFAQSPFCEPMTHYHEKLPLRIIYEVARISLCTSISIFEVFCKLTRNLDAAKATYDDVFDALTKGSPQRDLERSSQAAWEMAGKDFACVSMTGELTFAEQPDEPIFRFRLKPLTLDGSYRVARKYGGDRFLIVRIPEMTDQNFPKHLKGTESTTKASILTWLLDDKHRILGREWTPLFLRPWKPNKGGQKSSQAPSPRGFLLYLFATTGPGIETVSVEQVLRWFMPFERNQSKPALKIFARLQLCVSLTKRKRVLLIKEAVSTTTPTVQFLPWQIVRTRSAYSGDLGVRLLRKDADVIPARLFNQTKRMVMNDGCARISRVAAFLISKELNLDYVPSAFQGRIAGAKGMWMVDALGEMIDENGYSGNISQSKGDPAVWIEITDDQLKFEGPDIDEIQPDPYRVTFETNSFSGPLKSSHLNFQLVPILVEQGVPPDAIEELLRNDILTQTGKLKEAMSEPVALRLWNQEQNSMMSQRLAGCPIKWTGGFPDAKAEQINLLLESGFQPQSSAKLRALCREQIADYTNKLFNKMNITLGRSTVAFILADPLNVLEENEVHLAFSGNFADPASQFSDTMVHGVDVLVARNPALMPSDIQRVKAVFKPELASYKDIIIFSSKGHQPLADKLSGGDYDGDRAWLCWEPTLVTHFVNYTKIPETRPIEYFGIRKESTKISDIIRNTNFIRQFLHLGFSFNLQPSMVGQCTNYHEKFVYDQKIQGKKSVSSGMAITIAMLLGHLVDSAKGGLVFGETEWRAFLTSNKIPRSLQSPAFKDRKNPPPRGCIHFVDQLVFNVATKIIGDELTDLTKRFDVDTSTWDADVSSIWMAENAFEKHDLHLKPVLADLSSQISRLMDWWVDGAPKNGSDNSSCFTARARELRTRFLAIEPLESNDSPISARWRFESRNDSCISTVGSWSHLKSSALFNSFHKCDKLTWHACGKEICEIKALRVSDDRTMKANWMPTRANTVEDKDTRTGGARMVVRGLYDVLKVNAKMVRKLESRRLQQSVEVGVDGEPVGEDFDEIGTQAWADAFEERG